jgi:hypothetical protein
MPISPILYGRPGVYTTESLLGPTPTVAATATTSAAIAGEHWYGVPDVAYLCNTWADFVKYFGGFFPGPQGTSANGAMQSLVSPYFAYAAYYFFAQGGSPLWCVRVAPSSNPGVAASCMLRDSQATPQNTLQLVAGILGVQGNIGYWGNLLYVDVVAGSATGRFGLNIYKGGYGAGYNVESWPDLSMNKSDPRYALAKINSPTSGSLYVVAIDQNDTASNPAPAISNQNVFTGGLDVTADQSYVGPSVPDRVAVFTYGNLNQATPQASGPFDALSGLVTFALPGETNSTVVAAVENYTNPSTGKPNSFSVLDTPSGETPSAALIYGQGLGQSAYSAVFYPWVTAQDAASSNQQATKLLPPSGFVLGQMLRIDNQQGPWVAPAGTGTDLAGVFAVERKLAPGDLNQLNLSQVNCIRQRANGTTIIWGSRTLNPSWSTLYISVRRGLSYIEVILSQMLEEFVFAGNDLATWAQISNASTQILGALYQAGAFAGDTAADSYYVTCDSTVNTPQNIQNGLLTLVVGLALITPAEFIQMNIQQFQTVPGSTTTTVSGLAA